MRMWSSSNLMIAADGATQDFIVSRAEPERLYNVGDIGPSSVGTVFYVSNGGVHGLEAAGSGWYNGFDDPMVAWSDRADRVDATQSAIGSGSANTDAIVSRSGPLLNAAQLCRSYRGGGKHDWFLPSLEELREMRNRKILLGELSDAYWTSTDTPTNPKLAYYLLLGPGQTFYTTEVAYKLIELRVRPIRAF
jgi:hypothetical protein